LHAAVCKARLTITTQGSSNQTVTQTSSILFNKIYIYCFVFYIVFYIGTQPRTAVGRPIASTSSTGTPQKYVLMSQRPLATQVNLFHY